ncbi:GntR family transcriptional regulator [Streptomyces sp. bgisy060]|uniref:GntR family transcriptional regulator n=1 Tax=Streptomyces sp. bgisy060 TaxID=3413775 RepID=UPI003EB82B55
MSSRSSARWEEVHADIRRRITEGQLRPGDQVPGEFALAEEHGVSRNTVRTALTRLTQEGLITEGRGRLGRTVRAYNAVEWRLHRDQHAASSLELDDDRRPELRVSVSIEPLPAGIASRLQLTEGMMAARRVQVTLVDGLPYQLSTSWFPEDIARDTALLDTEDTRDPGEILTSIGAAQDRVEDRIAVRMPSPTDARELDLPAGTPIAEHTRTGFRAEKPLRVTVTLAPGDRTVLAYDMSG